MQNWTELSSTEFNLLFLLPNGNILKNIYNLIPNGNRCSQWWKVRWLSESKQGERGIIGCEPLKVTINWVYHHYLGIGWSHQKQPVWQTNSWCLKKTCDLFIFNMIRKEFFSLAKENFLKSFLFDYNKGFYFEKILKFLTNPQSKSRSDLGFSLKSDFPTTHPHPPPQPPNPTRESIK